MTRYRNKLREMLDKYVQASRPLSELSDDELKLMLGVSQWRSR